jgi:hypothetical protein
MHRETYVVHLSVLQQRRGPLHVMEPSRQAGRQNLVRPHNLLFPPPFLRNPTATTQWPSRLLSWGSQTSRT